MPSLPAGRLSAKSYLSATHASLVSEPLLILAPDAATLVYATVHVAIEQPPRSGRTAGIPGGIMSQQHRRCQRFLSGAVLATSALSVTLTLPAIAQEAAPGERAGATLEEITVTGTRIRRDDFTTPTPTTVVDNQFMENLGIVNVADMVTQIPSNVSNFQPQNTGGSAFFIGSTLANLRGLNPFFGTRTLTLVDSKRHVPTNNGNSVDLNAIPSVLIDRLEVVTGGASATYGSDAVSGVVNILLDKDLEGMKVDLDFGASDGDGENSHVGIAGGTEIFGGRGHIVAGGEYQKQDPILSCAHARDWCAQSIGIWSNGGFPGQPVGTPYAATVPGLPQNNILANRRANQSSYTGVIFNNVPGSTTTMQANTAGTGVVPFNIGQFGSLGLFTNEIGGDGRSIYDGVTMIPETERSNAMVSLTFDFTDNVRGFVDLSYANVLGINIQEAAAGLGSDQVDNCITPDNAYLVGNPALAAAVAARFGNGSFFSCNNPNTFAPVATVVRKDFTQQIGQIVNTDSDTTRWVLGLEGRIGESSWSWDAYYQNGKTDREQIGYDYRSSQRILFAVDAVVGPNGQPMCRILRDNVLPAQIGGGPPNATQQILAQGCAPLNVFGANSMSEAARAYAFGPIVEFNHIDQQIIAGTVTGELWKGLGAGPLVSAFGTEYREEKLRNDVNSNLPDPTRIDIVAQYGDSFGGDVEATEAFVELELPLLANKPGAQLLSVNAAYRDSRYDTTDRVRTGGTSSRDIGSRKISVLWDTTDWLRIRGSRSHDVRAAGFRELYWSLTQPAGPDFFGRVTNPWRPVAFPGDQRLDPRTLHLSGNVALRPEEADTSTIGFVLTPARLENRFRFSADYYQIEIENGIQGGSEARVIANCYNIGQDCQYIQGNIPAVSPNGFPGFLDITDTLALTYNARSYEAKGIDLAADYTIPLGESSIMLRLLSTHSIETIVTTPPTTPGQPATVRDISGQTGGDTGFFSDWAGSPDWVHNLVVTYSRGSFMFTAQGRYLTSGIIDKQTPKSDPTQPGYNPAFVGSVTNNRTSSHFTLNLNGSYNFDLGNSMLEVFGNVDNVLDEDPQFSSGAVGGANAIYFPILGPTYRLGVRWRM
jgi:iron complex outermembrane recepter protein